MHLPQLMKGLSSTFTLNREARRRDDLEVALDVRTLVPPDIDEVATCGCGYNT